MLKRLFGLGIFMLALSWLPVAQAALPDGVSEQEWDGLVARVKTEGTPNEYYDGTYLTLTRKVPHDRGHQADYLSAVGSYTVDGEAFGVQRFEAVFENWRRTDDGNWFIDQWLFSVTPLGTLRQAYHVELTESASGTVIEHRTISLSEEEAAAAWGPRLRTWLASLAAERFALR